ncbi:MAG TPA: hypothetical protein VFU90_15100 [Candidatus Tumulicola sp.]|nr:hypothetical protein [Candidatus Tumulicola sp.]
MSTIATQTYVRSSAEHAAERIYSAFGIEREGDAVKRLRAGPVARDAIVTLGKPERRPSLIRVAISWHVPDSGAFPHFRGFFEIRSCDGLACIALLGYYQPPFGVAGRAFDAIAGHRIANATIAQLLAEVADAVSH